MRTRRSATAACLAVAALPSVGLCAAATQPADPTSQQLLDEVRDLRAEVAELKAKLGAPAAAAPAPSTQPAAPSADAALQQVDREAAARTPFMDMEQITAGYRRNLGFYIRSEDGNFLLHPWAYIQIRNVTNYRENAKNGAESDTENGFELPRMKFILDGNVFSPDLTFQLVWATSDITGNLGLQDAWARYHIPNTPFAVRGGQIRDPFDHEQIIFGTRTLTPERSIVNNVLAAGEGIVKGVSVGYGYDTNSPVRTEIAYTSGERNFDTTFQGFPTNPASWGAAGRVEWKLMGDWQAYNQFTALDIKQPLLVLGAGADYTEAGDTGALLHVVDAQFGSVAGLSLYGAYLGNYTRHNGGAPGTNGGFTGPGPFADTYDSSVRLLAGWVIDRHWEPFVRYEYIHFDSRQLPATAAHKVIQDVTIGFNYYFYGQRAKFSAAASYLPDGSPISSGLNDLLPNHGGNEVIVQAQFQLII